MRRRSTGTRARASARYRAWPFEFETKGRGQRDKEGVQRSLVRLRSGSERLGLGLRLGCFPFFPNSFANFYNSLTSFFFYFAAGV